MGTVLKNLWVKQGTLSLPGKTIPFWGFSSFGRMPQVPGSMIEAVVGDILKITLFNNFFNANPIGEDVSIIFPGQENVMARPWPYGGALTLAQPQYMEEKLISLTNFVAPDHYYNPKALQYQFTARRPGIYLYESGTNEEKQIQMGVYGIIVVRPEGHDIPGHPNYRTAYGVGTDSAYDIEKILIIGEIDSLMHEAVGENTAYDMLNFKPDYWIVNGRTFPDTLHDDDLSSQPYGSKIVCKTGERILLRVINAGYGEHTFYLGGLVGKVVAEDSFPLATPERNTVYEKTGITLGAGQSVDLMLMPTTLGEIYLYDRQYNHLVNQDQFPGGMMTKVEVLA